MTLSIQDCLAAFSVSAMLNTEEAVAKARAVMEAFLEARESAASGVTAALHELRDAFTALKLDSRAALAILADIDDRIAATLDSAVRGGLDGNNRPQRVTDPSSASCAT